ncbi:Toluene efflux pump outer membrane protein TtgF precursor [Planctomycetes bacterium Pan216]|uniref:Toluene efflux pump outer membrane protein TtgF n=2 Tax=Kolteria novifilia TaxID=2527975 RepID=A0A518BAM3_9BACT|nr:Toluene efflux pump outer membrane protein TtgF precursor [Planctomycetes bacterium Pan216]
MVLVAGIVLLGASGCTSLDEYLRNGFQVGPDYGRPPAPIADHWIDSGDNPRLLSDRSSIADWWTLFNDPVLNGLVRSAYQQNLTVREAGFRVLAARASRRIAVGNLFPQTQTGNGGFTREALSTASANTSFVQDRFYSIWDYGFSLAWELDIWGRYRRAIEAADANLDVSVEEYDGVLVTLIADVASSYVSYRTAQSQIELATRSVKLQEISVSIAKARYKGGETSKIDVDQSEAILAQTQAIIPQQEIILRQANNSLCVLLGIPTTDLAPILGEGPIPKAPVDVAVGLPADLLRRRPDVRQAEREVAAQSAEIGIAETDLYPLISITGVLDYNGQDLGNLFRSNAFAGTIGPSFKWNIFNYGRIRANVELQRAEFQQLIAAYQQTVLTANQEVENGIVFLFKSEEQAEYLLKSVLADQEAVSAAVVQYRDGLANFTSVALLEQDLVDQQVSYVDTLGNVALGFVDIYRALGGGWQIRCQPPSEDEMYATEPPHSLSDSLPFLELPLPNAGANQQAAPKPESTPKPKVESVPKVTLPSTAPSEPSGVEALENLEKEAP